MSDPTELLYALYAHKTSEVFKTSGGSVSMPILYARQMPGHASAWDYAFETRIHQTISLWF